jgi:hypothetical protein
MHSDRRCRTAADVPCPDRTRGSVTNSCMFVVGGWLPDRPALRNFPSATPSDPTLMLGPIRTGYGAETKNKNTKGGRAALGECRTRSPQSSRQWLSPCDGLGTWSRLLESKQFLGSAARHRDSVFRRRQAHREHRAFAQLASHGRPLLSRRNGAQSGNPPGLQTLCDSG